MERSLDASQQAALDRLVDGFCVWRYSPARASAAEVIDAAVQCLVVDLDAPSLRELAGESPLESLWVLEPLAAATLDELGRGDVAHGDPAMTALEAMLRILLRGETEPRDIAKWAHRNIGHDGPERCQPFVDLDDMYDTIDYSNWTPEALDDRLRREAEAYLAGESSPGLTYDWRPLP